MACDLAHWGDAVRARRPRAGACRDHRRDPGRGAAPAGDRGRRRLSLRAVAREIGMVSSAVYRYVASRDELLTLLIIESYDALGAVVEAAAAPRRGRAPASGSSRQAARSARGRWPTRTSTRCSTAPRYPATRRRRTRSGPPRAPRSPSWGSSPTPIATAASIASARLAVDVPAPLRPDLGGDPRGRRCRPARRRRRGHGGRLDPVVRARQLRAVRPDPQRGPPARRAVRRDRAGDGSGVGLPSGRAT